MLIDNQSCVNKADILSKSLLKRYSIKTNCPLTFMNYLHFEGVRNQKLIKC
jgi:hypothetical protein